MIEQTKTRLKEIYGKAIILPLDSEVMAESMQHEDAWWDEGEYY